MMLNRDKMDANCTSPPGLVMSDLGILSKNDVENMEMPQQNKVAGTLLVVQVTIYNAFYSLMQSGGYPDVNTFLQHLICLEKTYQETHQETLKCTG